MAIPEWARRDPGHPGGWFDRDGRFHPEDVGAELPLSPPQRGGGPVGGLETAIGGSGSISPPQRGGGPTLPPSLEGLIGVSPARDGGPVGGPAPPMPMGVPPMRDGGPTSVPPAMAALSGLSQPWRNGGPSGADGAPATEIAVPGQRQVPASSRALATVSARRPGHRIY